MLDLPSHKHGIGRPIWRDPIALRGQNHSLKYVFKFWRNEKYRGENIKIYEKSKVKEASTQYLGLKFKLMTFYSGFMYVCTCVVEVTMLTLFLSDDAI